MKYDTTGPTTRNEMWSLLVLVCVVVVGGGAIWGAVWMWGGRPVEKKSAATARAPVVGFVQRQSDTFALVRGGDTYVNIYARGNEMSVRRTAGPEKSDLTEKWQLARRLQNLVNNPAMAKMYGLEDKVAELKAINLQPPALTPGEQSKLGMMFLQTQDLQGDARDAADQDLIAEVASVGVKPEEQAAFDEAEAKLEKLLTPEQMTYLRTGQKPQAKPAAATRPAASRPK